MNRIQRKYRVVPSSSTLRRAALHCAVYCSVSVVYCSESAQSVSQTQHHHAGRQQGGREGGGLAGASMAVQHCCWLPLTCTYISAAAEQLESSKKAGIIRSTPTEQNLRSSIFEILFKQSRGCGRPSIFFLGNNVPPWVPGQSWLPCWRN